MTRVIAGAGMFDTPSSPPERGRPRRRPGPAQRLLPADVDGELAIAMARARRRHPSARRPSVPAPGHEHREIDPVRAPADADRRTGLRLAQ